MRNFTLRFWIVLLTFAFGVITTFLWIRFDPFPEKYEDVKFGEIPTVEYCELKNNPRSYDGNIIRLKTKLNWFMHGYYLADGNCSGEGDEASMAIDFYEPKKEEPWKIFKEFHEKDKLWEPVDIVVVGRFSYKNFLGGTDHIQDRTHLQFEVHTIEFASR